MSSEVRFKEALGNPSKTPGWSKRTKSGCLTCRLRKKRCDGKKPICATCTRLSLECMGYEAKRPSWMGQKDRVEETTKKMKQTVSEGRAKRMRIYWSTQGSRTDCLVKDNSEAREIGTTASDELQGSGSDVSPASTHGADQGARLDRIPGTHVGTQVSDGSHASNSGDTREVRGDHDGQRGAEEPSEQPIAVVSTPDWEAFMLGGSTPKHLQWEASPGGGIVGSAFASEGDGVKFASPFGPQQTHASAPAEPTFVGAGPTSNPDQNWAHLSTPSDPTLAAGPMLPPATDPTSSLIAPSSSISALGLPSSWNQSLDPNMISLLNMFTHSGWQSASPNAFMPPSSIGASVSGSSAFMSPGQHTPFFPLLTEPAPPLSFPSAPFLSSPSDMRYLHHYLNIVLPLQFSFDTRQMSDLLAPLAMGHAHVLESVSSLAALHMAAKRRRRLPTPASMGDAGGVSDWDTDADLCFARTMNGKALVRLRHLPAKDFSADDVMVAAMTATSFHLFSGGTGKGANDLVALSQRCLVALIGLSGGIQKGKEVSVNVANLDPKYHYFLNALIWIDLLNSIATSRASTFIPLYRGLLLDGSKTVNLPGRPAVREDTVMGCDSTTRLALAETVALADWKEQARVAGCLSHRVLVERAMAIEKLLGERRWREAHLFEAEDPATVQRRQISEVFFQGARVLLAITVDGPYPHVPEVYNSVSLVLSAMDDLDITTPKAERGLILPLVLAGCHTTLPVVQQQLRDRIDRLGDEAAAFGNTRAALKLMEEVWRRRAASAEGDEKVDWREVMLEQEEEGLLLI